MSKIKISDLVKELDRSDLVRTYKNKFLYEFGVACDELDEKWFDNCTEIWIKQDENTYIRVAKKDNSSWKILI